MNTHSVTSRRRFLQYALVATGASVIGVPAVVSARSPNSKMNVACIAAGGRGRSHVNESKKMSDLVELVALCDVNSKALASAAALFPKARTYRDFRELHAKMPREAKPVPPELDWDLWIGPAPMRPFHDIYFPGPRWYRYWNFANGTMSDLGSHANDLPFWALKLDHPLTVEAHGPAPHPEITPANMRATWTYGRRGDLAPVTHHWYQGTEKPKIWTEGKIPQWKDGSLFIGERGMVLANYGAHLLMLDEKAQEFKRPPQTIEDGPSHQRQFIECARAGKRAPCDFAYSGLLTVANHLGGVAYRTGKKLKWDAVAGKTNDDAANRLLAREYRPGWKLL